jgi:hypothetical protein
MRTLRTGLAIVLLLLAAFCIFGFMASFEPGVDPIWKIVYATVGVGSVMVAIWLFGKK